MIFPGARAKCFTPPPRADCRDTMPPSTPISPWSIRSTRPAPMGIENTANASLPESAAVSTMLMGLPWPNLSKRCGRNRIAEQATMGEQSGMERHRAGIRWILPGSQPKGWPGAPLPSSTPTASRFHPPPTPARRARCASPPKAANRWLRRRRWHPQRSGLPRLADPPPPILPAGTMNVFARELGIPRDSLDHAFAVISNAASSVRWIRSRPTARHSCTCWPASASMPR